MFPKTQQLNFSRGKIKGVWFDHQADPLNLHLLEAVLPDNDVGGNTVLTVVEKDDPI
jgi:hypothetical protein